MVNNIDRLLYLQPTVKIGLVGHQKLTKTRENIKINTYRWSFSLVRDERPQFPVLQRIMTSGLRKNYHFDNPCKMSGFLISKAHQTWINLISFWYTIMYEQQTGK